MTSSTPSDGTSILRLYREYRAIIDAAGHHVVSAKCKDEDKELDRLFYQRADNIEAEMMDLPSTCAADFAAKLIVNTCNGGLFTDWETGDIWKEARQLITKQSGFDGHHRGK